jgi:hypothetical protein
VLTVHGPPPPASYAGPVSWSRKPKPDPKPRELERKVQAWGDRVAQSMDQGPEKTLQEAQDILKWSLKKNGPESPFAIKAMNEVANQLSRLNRVSEETPLREQIVDGLRKNVGPEDEATLNAEFKLATCLLVLETLGARAWSASVAKRMGRLDEARLLQEQVVHGYETREESESEQGQTALLNLASTLNELDQRDGAGRLVRSVLEVRRRTLGSEDPKTLEVQRVLASIEPDSE